jgi:hypothetical protein
MHIVLVSDSKRILNTPDEKLEVHPSLNNNVICQQASSMLLVQFKIIGSSNQLILNRGSRQG